MRWAQLTLVENDPGRFDPDSGSVISSEFMLTDSTLSAGGIVAYYPLTFRCTIAATGWATQIRLDTCWRDAVK